jgi:hypothetical protein
MLTPSSGRIPSNSVLLLVNFLHSKVISYCNEYLILIIGVVAFLNFFCGF